MNTPTAASTSRRVGPPSPTLIRRLDSIIEPLDFGRLFQEARPVEVELGSGDGSFLVAHASRHRDRNFLGVERLLGRLRKIDRKGLRAGLANLQLVRIEASYLLKYLLARESVSSLHVYFPDPWPKRKHRKNRLINEDFPEMARQILAPGGTVYLRTDDPDYFAQMITVFAAHPGFLLTSTPADLREIVTDFERDFLARGIVPLLAAYQRR